VSFLGAHGSLPMGVALLLAAVFGVLLVALPGTVRILQLRAVGRDPGSHGRPARLLRFCWPPVHPGNGVMGRDGGHPGHPHRPTPIRVDLARDTILTSTEAHAYGMVDGIHGSRKHSTQPARDSAEGGTPARRVRTIQRRWRSRGLPLGRCCE
jgi:hypothetical protein